MPHIPLHSFGKRRSQFVRLPAGCAGLLVLLVVCAGCGGTTGGREALSGEVVFQEKPLPEGSVSFVAETKGPTAGGIIEGGKFSIPADKGLPPGPYRVAIESWRSTGQKEPSGDDPNEMIDVKRQVIPPRYSEQFAIRVEVVAGGDNHFLFDLDES